MANDLKKLRENIMYKEEIFLVEKLLLKALDHTPSYDLVGFRQPSEKSAFCVIKEKSSENIFIVDKSVDEINDVSLATKMIIEIYSKYKNLQLLDAHIRMISYPDINTLWISPDTFELVVSEVIQIPPQAKTAMKQKSFFQKLFFWFRKK